MKFVKNYLPNFSHIYLEERARDYPMTKLIIDKYKSANVVEINHYKDFFNRQNQDFQLQKSSMKLIIAKKTSPFLYPASEMIQEYQSPNVFYNTPILNCIYNCDYCFLQGMYPSGNLVVFVNEQDYFDSVKKQLKNLDDPSQPMILSISYNTDIMATENIIPLTSRWIEFVDTLKNIKIEIRTKSALFRSLSNIQPSKNVILSWSLSPNLVCKKYERTAPSLKKRLKAMKLAIEMGWAVRLCIDPILYIEDWETIYGEFISNIFNEINHTKLIDVTLGVFRMNKDYYNRVRRRETKSDLFYEKYSIENNLVTVPIKDRKRMIKTIREQLVPLIDEKMILTWE